MVILNVPVFFFIILVLSGYAFIYFLRKRLDSFNEEVSWITDNYNDTGNKQDPDPTHIT